jgi:hypothetical protein
MDPSGLNLTADTMPSWPTKDADGSNDMATFAGVGLHQYRTDNLEVFKLLHQGKTREFSHSNRNAMYVACCSAAFMQMYGVLLAMFPAAAALAENKVKKLTGHAHKGNSIQTYVLDVLVFDTHVPVTDEPGTPPGSFQGPCHFLDSSVLYLFVSCAMQSKLTFLSPFTSMSLRASIHCRGSVGTGLAPWGRYARASVRDSIVTAAQQDTCAAGAGPEIIYSIIC